MPRPTQHTSVGNCLRIWWAARRSASSDGTYSQLEHSCNLGGEGGCRECRRHSRCVHPPEADYWLQATVGSTAPEGNRLGITNSERKMPRQLAIWDERGWTNRPGSTRFSIYVRELSDIRPRLRSDVGLGGCEPPQPLKPLKTLKFSRDFSIPDKQIRQFGKQFDSHLSCQETQNAAPELISGRQPFGSRGIVRLASGANAGATGDSGFCPIEDGCARWPAHRHHPLHERIRSLGTRGTVICLLGCIPAPSVLFHKLLVIVSGL